MNALDTHPLISANFAGVRRPVPYPFVGDLLLFLKDQKGPYCKNWNVKKQSGDHRLPFDDLARHDLSAVKKAALRYQMEEAYYLDAEIGTSPVSPDRLGDDLIGNLRRLYAWHARQLPVNEHVRCEAVNWFRTGMVQGLTPLETAVALAKRFKVEPETCRGILHQAIWRRELRVDLHHLIVMDAPLVPEQLDVLVEFKEWFDR